LLPGYVSSLDKGNIPADPGGYRTHRLYTPYVNTCFASKFSLFLPPRCICLFLIWRCTNGSFVPLAKPRSLKYAAAEMLLHELHKNGRPVVAATHSAPELLLCCLLIIYYYELVLFGSRLCVNLPSEYRKITNCHA